MNPPTIDVYRFLPDKSILDNIIHSKALRRPVYASTTQGAVTRAWRIEAHGSLTQIAMVDWEQGSISFGGVQRKLDEVLVKSKGLFQRDSRIVMIGDIEYKWKAAEAEVSGLSPSKKWRCTMLSGDLRDGVSVLDGQGQRRIPIATFTPPQQRRNAELQIFANLSQQPHSSVLLPHGYPISRSASTQPAIPSHFAPSHSPGQPRNYAENTAAARPGGQLWPRVTIRARVNIGRESAGERPPIGANDNGYTAPFPARPAHNIRSATSSLPRANESFSQNLVGPRRNRGPSDGILTGAISPSASERRRPEPISTPPAALESPRLAVIDGLMTCCILLAAGRLEYRSAQSEPPASFSSPSAPIDQRTQDGPQLPANRQGGLEIVSQIGLPRHILEVQRQLYESYMVAGSTSTLPIYEASEESSAAGDFRLIENQPSSLPPSYSTMGGE